MNSFGVVGLAAALGIAACQPAPGVAASDEPGQGSVQTVVAFGVAFDHAAGLETRPCGDDRPRCAILSDPAAEPYLRDLMTVQVHDGPLEAVAAAEAGFERNAEGRLMTTYGRFEPVAVEAFEVGGQSGLRAVVSCGVSDPETGFHAAAGECLWAVVSDGARSVVVSSSGFANGLEAAGAVVGSIRFTAD